MAKRIVYLLGLILFLCFMCGCEKGYKDSKLMFLPSGMCIDTKAAIEKEEQKNQSEKKKEKREEDKKIPKPAKSEKMAKHLDQGEPFVFSIIGPTLAEKAKETSQVYVQQGYTMEHGLQAAEAATSRNVNTSHVRTLTLGSELSSMGLRKPLFYFYRDPGVVSNTILTVAYGTTASNLIKQPTVDDTGMSNFIFNFFEGAINNLLVEEVNMTSFFKETNNFPYTGVIPTFSLAGKKVYWSGLALFQDDKMVAHLNRTNAQMVALINNVNKKAYLPAMKDRKHAVALVEGKTKIKPSYSKGSWCFLIKTDIEGDLLFAGKKSGYLTDLEMKELEKEISADIKRQIDEMIFLIQKKYKVDVLDLGAIAYKKDAKHIKKDKWQKDFVKAEIKTEVRFRINKIGEVY